MAFYYKYLPVNVNTLDALLGGKIYFNSLENFDDPMDSEFVIMCAEIAQKVPDPNKGFAQSCRELENRIKKEFGVFCVSTHKICTKCGYPDLNMVMLSLYADQHRGIIAEYCDDNKDKFEKVEYNSSFKQFELNKIENAFNEYNKDPSKIPENLLKPMLNKFNEWKYQEEYRLFNNKPNILEDMGNYGLTVNRIFGGFRANESILGMLNRELKVDIFRLRPPVAHNDSRRYRVVEDGSFCKGELEYRCKTCNINHKYLHKI